MKTILVNGVVTPVELETPMFPGDFVVFGWCQPSDTPNAPPEWLRLCSQSNIDDAMKCESTAIQQGWEDKHVLATKIEFHPAKADDRA